MLAFPPRGFYGAVFLGFALLFAGTLSASTMEAMSLTELTHEASFVVVGTVTARASQFDEFGRIVTDHQIEIVEHWKGDAGTRELTMRALGGEVGELGMTVPGAPHLAVGEQALFFLRPSALKNPHPAWLKPLGMSQGVFRIRAAASTTSGGGPALQVLPGAQGLRLLDVRPDGTLVDGQSAIVAPTWLADVRAVVQQLVARQRSTP